MKAFVGFAAFAGMVLAVCALPASAEILIDFETFPNGDPIPNGTQITGQLAPLGATTFRMVNPALPPPKIRQYPLVGKSGDNILGGSDSLHIASIEIEFSPSIVGASIRGLDVGAAGLTLEAFNASDTLVNHYDVTNLGDGSGNVDTLSVWGGDITRLVVRQIDSEALKPDHEGYVIDDLRFTPVPAPGAAVLGLIGLGLTGWVRRRGTV